MEYAIELTTMVGCANKCTYCPQDKFIRNYNSDTRILTKPSLDIMLRKLPKDILISLAGFSEPLSNPSIISLVNDSLSDRQLIIYTTLYNVEHTVIRSILNKSTLNIKQLVIHLPEKEGYMSIDVDNYYIKTVKLTLNLCRLHNILFDIIIWGDVHPRLEGLVSKYSKYANSYVHSSEKLTSRAGNLNNPNHIIPETYNTAKLKCYRQYYFPVLPNGDVYFCPNDFSLTHKLGNLITEDLESIIRGDRLQELLNGMLNGSNVICRKCSSANII